MSGQSSEDDEVEDGGVTDRRAIQQWNRYRTDYRKRTSNDVEPEISTPFSFLQLPFDVRRIIYDLLIKRLRSVVQMAPDGCGKYPSGHMWNKFFCTRA